jgi:pyruvate/2-oxoglutarate/acetoin dehydrogenase E1 component
MKYEYFVNLDERGMFSADVRDAQGKTVLEISNESNYEDEEGNVVTEYREIDLVEAGYMRHGRDLNGLFYYLCEMGIAKPSDTLEMGQ